ncbi:sensor histidine kinase [Marinobacter oulmenensis]|uniref:histidine kinase n=1 Tax=Marinobacter oulmenensis TaxID=643747 RepID=A0A840UK00_9GAMM|nr:ATP-binding protein [Marinobacter oulmenensis]MBB5321068.1 signal transduction histidine kinase [Marinobacter oulmenensis]
MDTFEDDPTLSQLLNAEQLSRLHQCLSKLCREPVMLTEAHPGNDATAVEFNLDTVGWLSGGQGPQEREAAADLVSFLMLFIGKYRLAANLHHDTTEASYAELQRQNEALRESEARYRELSNQLQQKVDEQVGVIRQTQQELYESARMRSVGQLAAGVAHEINNPIGFISSNLRVARDYVKDIQAMLPDSAENRELATDFHDLLNESIEGTSRIAAIVTDLKTFSSIDQADYTRCNIRALLASAIHLVQTEYDHRLRITEQLHDMPEISGHPSRLSQTFFNLLDNAAQALGNSETRDNSRILVKALAQNDRIQITIQDNGCGIPDSHRPRVFDAFYTTRPVGSGTGLGLTVAQDTVRAHGGQLQLHSREGAGTRVLLTLPIS